MVRSAERPWARHFWRPGAVRHPAPHSRPSHTHSPVVLPLSPVRRATLDALVRRVLPPGARDDTVAAVAATVRDRIATLAAHKQADLGRALDALGSRVAALATVGRAVPFAALDAARQDLMLARWERSRVPLLRTTFQAFRRLALAVYYAQPDVQRAIGYLGPLHERGPVLPWEGPLLRGTSEVVARGVALARVPSPAAAAYARPGAVLAVADGSRLTAEVIVVGTGAGGAIAAARLAAAGRDVLLLEEGDLVRADEFTEREAAMTERLYADGGLRATEDLGVSLLQGRAVGGGTTVNWLIMLRTPDHVLAEWATHHGTTGMSAAEMRPVFERIEREVHARPVPDDAHSPNNRILLDGAGRLGWRTHRAIVNARGCVRSGFCGQGCRYDAKQGALLTWVPTALGHGARLLAGARATRLEQVESGGAVGRGALRTSPRKRVHIALHEPRTGRALGTATAEAPVVVVAGGAVGTPVLLERSGLGGGGVGRWLRLHPTTAVSARYDRPIHASAGIPLSAMCDEFADLDGRGYGVWLECPPVHPSLMAAASPGFGAAHAALLGDFATIGALIVLARDGAERTHSSGRVRVDRRGHVRLDYRLHRADAAHLAHGITAAARLHLAAGAREVFTLHTDPVTVRTERDLAWIAARSLAPNDVALFSAHVNGTCRMGTDPETSGTTPHGERHGAPGIFVADGSLLPTAPGVNPQETIMALASVVAERMIARW